MNFSVCVFTVRASLHVPGLICSPGSRVLKIYPLHEPGLPLWTSIWFTTRLTRVSLSTDENLKIRPIKITKIDKIQSDGMVVRSILETN